MDLHRIASRVAGDPAPAGQVIALLNKILAAKYAVEVSYRSYADRIRGHHRDAIVEHWQEHAADERKSAYAFAMQIVALGGDPMLTAVTVPQCVPDVQAMMSELAAQEQAAIAACEELIGLAGADTALKVLAEDAILLDSHHLQDLIRMGSVAPGT